jgi:hypothetical protein
MIFLDSTYLIGIILKKDTYSTKNTFALNEKNT